MTFVVEDMFYPLSILDLNNDLAAESRFSRWGTAMCSSPWWRVVRLVHTRKRGSRLVSIVRSARRAVLMARFDLRPTPSRLTT